MYHPPEFLPDFLTEKRKSKKLWELSQGTMKFWLVRPSPNWSSLTSSFNGLTDTSRKKKVEMEGRCWKNQDIPFSRTSQKLRLLVVEPTHLKNIIVKLDHFPKVRGENKKYVSCHHLVESVFFVVPFLIGNFLSWTSSLHSTRDSVLTPMGDDAPLDSPSMVALSPAPWHQWHKISEWKGGSNFKMLPLWSGHCICISRGIHQLIHRKYDHVNDIQQVQKKTPSVIGKKCVHLRGSAFSHSKTCAGM